MIRYTFIIWLYFLYLMCLSPSRSVHRADVHPDGHGRQYRYLDHRHPRGCHSSQRFGDLRACLRWRHGTWHVQLAHGYHTSAARDSHSLPVSRDIRYCRLYKPSGRWQQDRVPFCAHESVYKRHCAGKSLEEMASEQISTLYIAPLIPIHYSIRFILKWKMVGDFSKSLKK